MKRILTLKGAIALAVMAMLLAGAAAYAAQHVSDRSLTGNVQLATISTTDPIQLFHNGQLITSGSGDTIDFGSVEVDFFGRIPLPVRGPFYVKNVSNGPVEVIVTGDLRDDIVPLFGPTQADLKPAPDNAFTLAAPGLTGDTMTGYLGLSFLTPSPGSKSTTIIFRATEVFAPATSAHIAFIRNGWIYVMNADGSNQAQLTPSCCLSSLAWSPDDGKIAFSFSNRIYLMDADGTNHTLLSSTASAPPATGDGSTGDVISPAFGHSPAWSPEGSMIAFSSSRYGQTDEIYVMTSTGDHQTRLTTGGGRGPAWSPDGSKIAFWLPAWLGGGILVMNVDGSNQTYLTTSDDRFPDWSPDGTKIVFESIRDGNSEIYVMTSTGDNQTNLTRNIAYDRDPAWSPDGNTIVFVSSRDGNSEIYVMDADGFNQTRLTNSTASDCCPDWSPGIVP